MRQIKTEHDGTHQPPLTAHDFITRLTPRITISFMQIRNLVRRGRGGTATAACRAAVMPVVVAVDRTRQAIGSGRIWDFRLQARIFLRKSAVGRLAQLLEGYVDLIRQVLRVCEPRHTKFCRQPREVVRFRQARCARRCRRAWWRRRRRRRNRRRNRRRGRRRGRRHRRRHRRRRRRRRRGGGGGRGRVRRCGRWSRR